MRKLRVLVVALFVVGLFSASAAPVSAGPIPCKIVYHDKYIAPNPLCLILEDPPQ